MADDNSKSWTLLKGIGGVASAVLTAVLIYYFTKQPPTPTPVPTPTAITAEGLVSDFVSHAPVYNANVTVSIGPNSVQQKTDEEGRYAVILNGTGSSAEMGTVAIAAAGYEPYTNTLALTAGGQNFNEFPMAAIPQPGQPAAPKFPLGKPIILKTPPPGYTKKNVVAYQPNFKK
jgi:hypothetical protein